MRKAISASLVSLFLAAAALPAFADYSEGDPRPMPLPSQLSAADVSAQTRQWLATAPTLGYPDGNPREFAQVSQNNRAQVSADSIAWTKSGMAKLSYGDYPVDANSPAYQEARKSYWAMSGKPTAAK